MEYKQMMLKKVIINFFICVTIIVTFQSRSINGYTRLQASTDFACTGENITFSCTTLKIFLIWEVTFTDRTVGSITYSFHRSDHRGRLFSKSIRDVHLYFQLVSNGNGTLHSILVVYASSAFLQNAMIECYGTETRRLILRLAYAPSAPTGLLISEKVYNSSDFASVTLSWNDAVGRVDSYNIKMSVGSSLLQQFSVMTSSLMLDQFPYNVNVTVGISALNCVAESEEANFSFAISACNFSLSLPLLFSGLVYNTSSSFNKKIVPSGEQLWFGCEEGFYPRDPMISTCQEGGLWYPDPNELICHMECLIPMNLTNLELSRDNMTSLSILFHCKDGFIPKDEQIAVCSSNGSWSPDLTQFNCECHRPPTALPNTDSVANSTVDRSCINCLIYIVTGSVVGIATLLVICGLLLVVMICIILSYKRSKISSHDGPEPIAVYDYITGPIYEYLNPTLTSVMTDNEAYNTCCEEIRDYDVV